jgi:hypothetical protein
MLALILEAGVGLTAMRIRRDGFEHDAEHANCIHVELRASGERDA